MSEKFDDQGTQIGPQRGPQTILLASECEENFFGGALGAGKSYALALDIENQHQKYGKHVSGIIFRQTVPELDDLIKTFKEVLEPFGWVYGVGKKTFKHPDGAECRMRHCENEKDVKKYWGHQYCVGKGAPIVMADGSHKPIEDIVIGDLVATLEGPKKVTGLMPPRMSECVKAEIFDKNGVKTGEQIQPSKHPLLSSDGMLCEWSRPTSRIHEKLPRQSYPAWTSFQSLLGVHQESQESGVFEEDARIHGKEFEHSNSSERQLLSLTFPVVLHEPSLQLALSRSLCHRQQKSTQSDSLHKLPELFEQRKEDLSLKQTDQRQQDEQLQLHLSGGAYKNADEISCAHVDSQTTSNYCPRCFLGLSQCDEQLLPESDSVQGGVPSLGDVEGQVHACQRQDDKGNIQQCNRLHCRGLEYIHPYTAKRRDVVEKVQIGSCKLTPVGEFEVYDFCVEDANHYITAPGCINKNTYMGVDEYGDFNEEQFNAIQKIRAARLRSAAGVKTKFVATANPCGAGHKLCKERYIDPSKPFKPYKDPRSKHSIVFIPGRMENNIKMLMNDPEYRDRCMSMGPVWYVNALINGDWTISPEGNMFHREWFNKRFDPNFPPEFLFKVISWDTAFKTTKKSAESAATVWGVTKSDFYLLDAWSAKVEFPELKQKAQDLYHFHNSLEPGVYYNWIEDKASGPTLVQSLTRDTSMPLKAIKVDGDKLRRAFGVTPYFESGRVWLPAAAPWLDKYIEQLCSFPAPTGYADLVDSTSQALNEIVKVQKQIEFFSQSNVIPVNFNIYQR